MKSLRNLFIILLVVQLLAACSPVKLAAATLAGPTRTAPVLITATIETTGASTAAPTVLPGPLKLTVLYTNDEHGWFSGVKKGQSAANLLGLWRQKEGYAANGAFLVLSGGDNWTGPAVSTWFKGQSMVEVMNTMGYAASAVGNHEFDFGLDVLKIRISEAKYPYLSANLRTKDGGQLPADLGIKAYTVLEVNHIKIGIIGLTTILLPELTKPANRGDFIVIDYQQALREVLPSIRSAGADLVFVDGHICADEMETLARQVNDLGIALITGGHCNDLTARKVGDTVLLEGGTRYQNYATATFTYDPVQRKVQDEVYNVKRNTGGQEDPALVQIFNRWQAKADAELNATIGYLKEEIPQGSDAMGRLITNAWLKAFPDADVAITNKGGMTNHLPSGVLKLADIIAMMPFENTIMQVKIKGSDLLQAIQGGVTGPVIGGMHQQGGEWILEKTGNAVLAGTTYRVLINDFMYSGGDNYKLFAQADPDGYNSGIDWRQPVIDWIQAQNSTIDNPLDPAIFILGH